jgi:hypothetical protein
VVAGVAVASRPASPATKSGHKKCPATPGVTQLALMNYSAGLPQTGTTIRINQGDILTVHLLRSGASTWTIVADDDSVLQPNGSPSTQTDPTAPGGTDDVVVFIAIGTGQAIVTGTGGGGSFRLTVNVGCG